MFCGSNKSLGKMNMEHFVPKCLWSDQLPRFMKTCPAHVFCNSSFAKDNDYFRDILVIDAAAGSHPEVQKLQATIYRKLRKYKRDMAEPFAGAAVRPIHSPSGLYLGHQPTLIVNKKRRDRVLTNVIKGMFYTIKNYPLPQGHRFSVYPVDTRISSDPRLLQVIGNLGSLNSFGDDVFSCRCATDPTETDCFIGLMQFYRCQTFLGLAYPPTNEFVETSVKEFTS